MMSFRRAKTLLGILREVKGVCTLLVVPEKFKEPAWANKDFPVEDPFVISGRLKHESFFEAEKKDGTWNGVTAVVLEHKEIPVQWISDVFTGLAYTLVDEDAKPVAIFKSYEDANKEYVKRWPPADVHRMKKWPRIVNPEGEFERASAKRAGLSGLEYPWFA